MALRVLIVDDEPVACEWLRSMLQTEPDVEVVGVCTDAKHGLAAVRQDLPDLVFLDIRMPGMDGFAFINALPKAKRPLIILVTADDRHGVRAFEDDAIDYLLKPIDRERLQRALRRGHERIQSRPSAQLHQNLADLRQHAPTSPETKWPDRLSVRDNGRIVFVRFDEIDWVSASGNYVELHVGNASHLYLSTLTAFEEQLPPGLFLRISRSIIINHSRIKEVRFHRHGDGTVTLADGEKLAFSRIHRHKLDQLTGRKAD